MPKTTLPIVLSPTRSESGHSCYRKHAIKDLLERDKGRNKHTSFGTVMHAGVGALHSAIEWKGLSRVEALVDGYKALAESWATENIVDEKLTEGKAATMLEAYAQQFLRVGPFDLLPGRWKPLMIEDRIKMKVGDFVLSFQQDRSYQNLDSGMVAFGDLKTVSRPDANWKAQWYQSLQMKLYARGTRRLFETDNVEGFIEGLDKNAKPKLHYVPLPHWSEEMLDEAERQFLAIANKDEALVMGAVNEAGDIDMAKFEYDVLVNTAHNRGSCFDYHSACAFLPLCNAEPSERRGILHAEYEVVEQDY